MNTLFLYLFFFGLFFIAGVPIVLSLSVASLIMLIVSGLGLLSFAQKFMVSMDNFNLTAMFFFIFAGELMNNGGMTRRIVSAVSRLVKGIPGGLPIVALISCAFFAAINGSAIATSVAIGSIMYPAMVKQGYPPAFSASVIAAGGIVGPIIPPSIPMIVYGAATGDSIAALFSGGILLGILITVGEVVVAYFVSRKKGYGRNIETLDLGSSKGIMWALIFPIIIFITIIGGIMTATETSALAVFYAFFVGKFIYKELEFKKIPLMILNAMKGTGAVMAIVGAATAVGWVLTFQRVPQQITEVMVASIKNPSLFMLLSFGILFIVGMIMDLTPAILILTPIFMGPVKAFGIDPVYFGVFFCTVLTAGLITPPVGTLIYLGCSQSKASFGELVRWLIPFIIVVYLVLFFTVLFPDLLTFLPKHVFHLY
ncbi:MAG: TRAP transporter large permease [Spirochaetes bacterium]|nr:TRAP transporter large permease [Spirochaetota bacterium]